MKLWKAAAVGMAGLAGLVALYSTSQEKEITPACIADANGDGIQDAFVVRHLPNTAHSMIYYFDGRNFRIETSGPMKKSIHYIVSGVEIPIPGTGLPGDLVDDTTKLNVGNFDNDPRMDIHVSAPAQDQQEAIDRFFYNVLPAPKIIKF